MEVIVTIVSKLGYNLFRGHIQPTYIRVIIQLLSTMDIQYVCSFFGVYTFSKGSHTVDGDVLISQPTAITLSSKQLTATLQHLANVLVPLDPKTMKNEGFRPSIYGSQALKMKVLGSHGNLSFPKCDSFRATPLSLSTQQLRRRRERIAQWQS